MLVPELPEPVPVPVPVRLPLVSPGMPRPAPVPSPVVPGVVAPGVVLPGVVGELPMPGPGMLLPGPADPTPAPVCASASPGAMNPERMRANIVLFMMSSFSKGVLCPIDGPTLQAPYHLPVAKGDSGSANAAFYAQEQLFPDGVLRDSVVSATGERLFQHLEVRGA